MDASQQPLAVFGQVFIQQVRDNALFVFGRTVTGHMKGERAQEMRQQLKSFSPEQMAVVKDLVYQMVDTCLHHTLFMFQEHPEWVISQPDAGIGSLNELSDGLAGELYTEDGWIEQFSKYAPGW